MSQIAFPVEIAPHEVAREKCRAGLIAPLTHPDGSPVMRNAESVKTRAHPVRIWAVASVFSAPAEGAQAPTFIEPEADEAANQTASDAGVGESRHSHTAEGARA